MPKKTIVAEVFLIEAANGVLVVDRQRVRCLNDARDLSGVRAGNYDEAVQLVGAVFTGAKGIVQLRMGAAPK